MKSVKMFSVLAISMASLTVNALIVNDSSLEFSLGNKGYVKFSVNTPNENGNILHNIIRNSDNETLKFVVEASMNVGIIEKERKEKMQQYPYNMFRDDSIAQSLYAKYEMEALAEDIVSNVDGLRELLLEKDSDGKTPIDLLLESKKFDSVEFEEMYKGFMEMSVESLEEKQARLQQRKKEKKAEIARLLFIFGKHTTM